MAIKRGAIDRGSTVLIMSDFNYLDIDWENWNTKGDNTNSHEYKFVESIQDNFLHQHTRKPTRWRGTDNPHIVDLIVTNEETMISNLEHVSPLRKSDHCLVFLSIEKVFLLLPFMLIVFVGMNLCSRFLKRVEKVD